MNDHERRHLIQSLNFVRRDLLNYFEVAMVPVEKWEQVRCRLLKARGKKRYEGLLVKSEWVGNQIRNIDSRSEVL